MTLRPLACLFVALAAGCGSSPGGGPDLAPGADLARPASWSDLATAADLASPPDLAEALDLPAPVDATPSEDLTSPLDLVTVPDLVAVPDFTALPDLTPPADLTPRPDLTAPTCVDHIKNGSETDVDCGGGMCPPCADGLKCGVAADCTSGVCTMGQCAVPSCKDGVKNGTESDVDCGGSCPKCAAMKKCGGNADCASGICTNGACVPCTRIDDCASGSNCVAGACVAAQASCALQKMTYPSSGDGEYWISPGGNPTRAYCDMQLQVALCTEAQGVAQGQTREGSALVYQMTSLLKHVDGTCELWAIRGLDNYPIDLLNPELGQTLGTCQALGFVADGTIDGCAYGAANTNCGYTVGVLHRYGNLCGGCKLNDGPFRNYVLQGPMNTASVLSSFDGAKRARCKIR
jgi:hypothetical protein